MRYQPGQSVLHRLHPVVKLAWLLWVTAAVFLFGSAALPLWASAGFMALLWLSGIAPWRIPGLRVWLVLGAAILVTHTLAVRGGEPVWGPVTGDGLASGVRASGRLLAVILGSALFVTTTEPVSLARALMDVGLPYRWGFALMTALRLVPIFRVEAHQVYRAQMVRGVAYDASGLRKWWLMLRHLCMPLLVSALRMAHSLSLSMEGRGFGLHRRRTYVRDVPRGKYDVVAGALLVLSLLAALWVGWLRNS